MKHTLMILLTVLLAVLLLAGCRSGENVASGGDLTPEMPDSDLPTDADLPASGGDVSVSLRPLLLEDNGYWRSEQEDVEREVVIVRELELYDDGSFIYREGDWASEYSYFAEGTWALSGDLLSFQATETDEYSTTLVDKTPFSTDYVVSFDESGLSLTLESERGFCQDAAGLTVHYYHPIV